jgi:hypothetical protein
LTRLAELELLAGLFAGVFAEAELDEDELLDEAELFADFALSRTPSGTFLSG